MLLCISRSLGIASVLDNPSAGASDLAIVPMSLLFDVSDSGARTVSSHAIVDGVTMISMLLNDKYAFVESSL
jgi:hypothetical protein